MISILPLGSRGFTGRAGFAGRESDGPSFRREWRLLEASHGIPVRLIDCQQPQPVAVADSEAGLFRVLADRFVAHLQKFPAVGRPCRIALSGGRTPAGLFDALVAASRQQRTCWLAARIFWVDERMVPRDHADSNYRLARERLLQPLAIAECQTSRFRTEVGGPDEVAADYEKQVAREFGVSQDDPPPVFDLVLLGMGSDGHTASLFPFTDGLNEVRRWVIANGVPQLATVRCTMTLPLINRAQEIWFLVTGADKADAVREVLLGPRDLQRLPAQSVNPPSGAVHWFLDAEAAAGLPV